MSTITTLTSSANGRIARFIRLSLNSPVIRAHLRDLPSAYVFESGALRPGFDTLATRSYHIRVANALLSVAHESRSIELMFEYGALFQICNLQICWDEDGGMSMAEADSVLTTFILNRAIWFGSVNMLMPSRAISSL